MPNEIILIEDSESDAEIVLRAFRKANVSNTVTHLRDGEKALEFFFGTTGLGGIWNTYPKLILLDLKMPKVDGLELIKKLKGDNETRTIPLVVITSSREYRDIKEAYKLGVNSYVVKSSDYEGYSKLIIETVYYWLSVNQSL